MRIYIYSDGYIVHAYDANDYDHQIISGTLTMEFNRSGSLTFAVPPNNEAHKNGKIRDLVSVICVKNLADNFEWYGRVIGHETDILGSCSYTCEGVLGRLNDIPLYPITTQKYFLHASWTKKYNAANPDPELSIGSGPLFNGVVQQYNDRLKLFNATTFDWYNLNSQSKLFEVSYYGNDPLIQEKETKTRKNPSFENALDYVQSEILDYGEYGFHIETDRKTVNNSVFDRLILRSNDPAGYYNESTKKTQPNFTTSSKALIFGRNLLDFSYKSDYSSLYNAMHFKATIKAEYSGGNLDDADLEYTTTREWVYPVEDTLYWKGPDLTDDGAIAKHGLLMGHEDLNGSFYATFKRDTPAYVDAAYKKATNSFHDAARARVKQLLKTETETIEIRGINMTGTGDTIPFRIYQYIPVISDYHNIKAKYLCTAITLDLCNPGNSTFILGSRPDGATEKWTSIAKQPLDNIGQYYTEEVI